MRDQVAVWVDHPGNSGDGAQSYAGEWAGRLGWSLQPYGPGESSLENAVSARSSSGQTAGRVSAAEYAPARHSAVRDFLKRGRLCVVGKSLPWSIKSTLLRACGTDSPAWLLFCPNEWTELSRALILNDDDAPRFLLAAVQFCGQLGARPIVLTVGATERDALARERRARAVLERAQLTAEYDVLTGQAAAAFLPRIAEYRRCQVVVNRYPHRRWWRWGLDRVRDHLALRPGPVAILTVPMCPPCCGESSGTVTEPGPSSAARTPRPALLPRQHGSSLASPPPTIDVAGTDRGAVAPTTSLPNDPRDESWVRASDG